MRAISIVTLGVRELGRSADFYSALGFKISSKSNESIVWFRTGGTVLAVSMGCPGGGCMSVPPASGFRGVTMAMNMEGRPEVDAMIETARKAGANVVKEPQDVFWGGYSSYFEDPDGHLWEVAWNPFTPVDRAGVPAIDD